MTTTKAIWLSQEKNGYTLNAASSVITPPSGMLSDSPFDQELMARTIRQIVNQAKITIQNVNIALPDNQVYAKVVEMPLLSDSELSSAIYWQAEQYIPIPLSKVKFDYKILHRPQNAQPGATMEVLLVGAQTQIIEKYQKVLTLADLNIASIETEMLATIRSLVTDEHFPATLIMNMRAVSTSIAIVRQGTMVFTYAIPVGGATISRAIAQDLGLTSAQAEEYKKTYGVFGKELEGKIGKASEPILMSIVSEIRKALLLYDEKYKKDEPIQQILLVGDTAKLPGIDLFFAQNCGIETVVANPWKVLNAQQLPKEMLDNAPDYALVVGLAMRQYE